MTPSRSASLRSALAGACLLVTAGAGLGCDSIRLTTVDTQKTVLSRTRQVVSGGEVQVQTRLRDTTLLVRTTQGCALVEQERVRTVAIREADEDLSTSFIVLGLGSIPLATGIAMMVDAPQVYPDDRHGRQYNSVGEEGAMIGGIILTSVGGLLTVVPVVQLIRIAAAGEKEETLATHRGDTVDPSVPCGQPPDPVSTGVELRVGATTVGTFQTDEAGRLQVDLVRAIPAPLGAQHDTVTVIVAGRAATEIDLLPIRDAQIRSEGAREDHLWSRIDTERCRTAPAEDRQACAPLRAFLEMFPRGEHARQARRVLQQHAHAAIVAAPAVDDATQEAIDAADQALEQKARARCERECRRSCQNRRACVVQCVTDLCPPPWGEDAGSKQAPRKPLEDR